MVKDKHTVNGKPKMVNGGWIVNLHLLGYNTANMIQVTRKDSKESVENLLRRFSRKVQQSGVLAEAKAGQYFEKPMSRIERRQRAILRRERKEAKIKKLKLGR